MDKHTLITTIRWRFGDRIADAFEAVPREAFVPMHQRENAYIDTALPIGLGQTISQPTTIAYMLQLLDPQPGHHILEIGSGCGYVVALLAHLVGPNGRIHGIELDEQLATRARAHLSGYTTTTIHCRDGRDGLPDIAPWDRIICSAAWDHPPLHLTDQLKEHGSIVAPCRDAILHIGADGDIERHEGFMFVPMRGKR